MSVAFRRESDEEHLEPKFEIPIPPGPNLVTARGLAQIKAKVVELEDAIKAARRELRYWGTRQATAQLAPVPAGDIVEFGCTVTFRQGSKERTICIVGDDEADPAGGLISFSAPLVRAMMEAEQGESVAFGGKPDAIEIVAITVPDAD
jgi:transcription elongation GreA/GreB family factor